jgi:hypothetical protein
MNSWGHTIEKEEIDSTNCTSNSIKAEIVELEEGLNCRLERFKAYTNFRSQGLSHEEADSRAYAVFFVCMSVNSEFELTPP